MMEVGGYGSLITAVRVHDENSPPVPESDLRPIRRPGRRRVIGSGQPSLIAAVGVHYKNSAVEAVPLKCDLCAVRRPDGLVLIFLAERQLLSITAVRVHRVDVRLRVALTANERNTTV